MAAAVVLIVLAGVVLALLLLLAAPLRSDAGTQRMQAIVVGADDTIWDLARLHAPAGQDLMLYVAEVVAVNDVDATALQPGMVLHLPT